jgi:hypothetical protein
MKNCLLLVSALCIFISSGFSQNDASKPIVQKPIYFDVSPPLKDMAKQPQEKADNSLKVIKNYFKPVEKSFGSDWVDPSLQKKYNSRATTLDSTIQNFDGNSNTQGYDPPDIFGQVGPNDYFALVNCHFTIFDKTGTVLQGPTSNSTMWNGMPNNMNGGDGVVMYDAQADRWFFAQLSYPTGQNLVMIAVSQTPDPTGSWYRWEYSFGYLPDYIKFGVWPDGYYMTANRFSGNTFSGTGQYVFDRAGMIAGNSTAQMLTFTLPASNPAYSLLPASCDGNFPPLGTPNYFVYMKPSYLGVYEFHVDWDTTSNSTFGNYLQLPVTAFNDNVSGIPQKGTSRLASTLADRLMYRLQFRKFSDHWGMVCNQTVVASSSVAGIRWYELQKTTGDWSVHQQSTYAPADGNHRWMGSIAMDSVGNIGLGFSISSSSMYPAIKYTGRLKNDPLNVLDLPEKGIVYGTASNNANDSNGECRWGDYSSLTVDPSDGMTFWYTQEYFTSMGSNWKTRVASFSLGSILSALVTATPDTLCIGDSTHLNTLVSGGSGTFTYTWTSVPAGFTSSLQNPVVAPAITTTYFVVVNDGSSSVSDSIVVNVNAHAAVYAGTNASYPNITPVFPLNNGSASNYSSLKWLTSGDGYFSIDTILTPVYFTGTQDKNNGGVLLTLKGYPLHPCADTATDTVFIRLTFPDGIAKPAPEAFDVTVIPNPSTGIFNLDIQGSKNVDINVRITDIEGKVVFQEQKKSVDQDYSKTIDLTDFPKGVYVIKVENEGQVITKKVVLR